MGRDVEVNNISNNTPPLVPLAFAHNHGEARTYSPLRRFAYAHLQRPSADSLKRALLLTMFSLAFTQAGAAPIVVGQTSGFSGASEASVKEGTDGAKLYIEAVNARGGVNGQRIDLVSLDDRADNKLAAANARILITKHGAIALFFTRGTPQSEAIMPVLQELRVPLVAPSTGAMVLHLPVNRWIFNVRSTYQREAEKAVSLLQAIGITSIAVLHVDDSFGLDALTGARRGFDIAKLTPVLIAKFDKSKPNFRQAAADIARLNPQALMVFGSGATVADAISAVRAAGSRAQLVTLSNNAASGFVKALKGHARGTIVTQVFPYERSISSPLVKEAQGLARARGSVEISPATLEGFAAAKVLVEGLRRAGGNPTGERLRSALESIRGFDIGGMDVSYSSSNHTGLDFVDLSIINKEGTFTR